MWRGRWGAEYLLHPLSVSLIITRAQKHWPFVPTGTTVPQTIALSHSVRIIIAEEKSEQNIHDHPHHRY